MTSAELRDVFDSTGFKQELAELSAYLASIMQERPIVYLLAKYLRRRGHKLDLEANRCDLLVNDTTRVEFKFNFNRCESRLKVELERCKHDLAEMKRAVKAKELNKSFGVAARIIRDVCDEDKRPDIFVWIICSRDLSNLSEVDRKYVALADEQCKHNSVRPYNSDGNSLVVIDEFLELLRSDRDFSLQKLDIPTDQDFPSTYHFRICEFSK